MTDKPVIVLAMWRSDRQEYSSRQEVIVQPMEMRDDKIRHPSWYAYEGLSLLEDLRMEVSISDTYPDTNTGAPPDTYFERPHFDCHRNVDYVRSKAMTDMLGKLAKAMKVADAHEYGDVFAVFAKVVGAVEIVVPRGYPSSETRKKSHFLNSQSFEDVTWTYWTPGEGKNIFRRLITEAVEDEKVKRGWKEAA